MDKKTTKILLVSDFNLDKFSSYLGEELSAKYIPAPKSRPCLEFLKASGLQPNKAGDLFSWKMEKVYPSPAEVNTHVV